jgi:predicted ATPase/class 3 adenylate cyclase
MRDTGIVAGLPSGTVTFLFTDLESSTRLWERDPGMQAALARHDEVLRTAVESHGGHVVKTTGDGIHAVFSLASDALAAAVAMQRALGSEPWGEVGALRVRMGLHSGAAEQRGGDYFGPVVNRAARIMALGHGGQVLCSQATADLVRDSLPDGVDLLDLGSHALRDISRPEEVFQVTHPDLERDLPPLQSPETPAGNLPPQRTEFIGRDQELAKIEKLMDRSRVVTLTGVGGVGKTRLALQAAGSLKPRFGDGAWFVDLGPIDDADLVAGAVASAMRLPDRRQGSPEDAIVAAAREWRAVIVLDNCEHVIEAAARLAELVTDRCDEVVIVATSREALGIDGEQVLAVGPLPVPTSEHAARLEELAENEAVRLFVQRASAARADFCLTDDNAALVASVCRRLDGIPLAIQLAAARVQSMSPDSILERLDERFRLLSQGRRTALARHQTLRAAVDWSYDLLDPAEQLAFIRLSVFAGGFTLEAAEAVVPDEDTHPVVVLDTLGGLVAKSIVLLDDEATTTARYRLLDTMREYAADRLEELDRPERVADRHAEFYLQMSEQAAPHIMGPDDFTWTRRLEAEHDNLHAALTWVRDRDPTRLTRLAHALGHFWRFQRHHHEALGWMSAALELDPNMSPRVRAELAAEAGYTAIQLPLVQQADEFLRRSLEASSAAGDEPNPYALMAFALRALVTTQPADARNYAEEALAGVRPDQQPFIAAECLSFCSVMISLTSEDPRGLELADRAIEMARPLGNDHCLGAALQAAGLARYRTDPAAAIALLNEGIDVSTEASGTHDMSFVFKGFAHLSLREYGPAARAFDAALAFHHAAGAVYYQSVVLAAIAGLLARTGSTSTATQLLGALERLRDNGRIVGAPRDLAMQQQLRDRLENAFNPSTFAEVWAAGRQLVLDDAVSLARAELSQLSA